MYFNEFVFEKPALETKYGYQLFKKLADDGLSPKIGTAASAFTFFDNELERYKAGKRTLIFCSRNPSKFENCRPSAHYQLPITSGCPGLCEYCYLMTRTGSKSGVKLNCNIDKIFTMVNNYINIAKRKPVLFELSSSSDPIPFEEATRIVSKIIEYFATLKDGRLRICTKYEPTDSILNAKHYNNTDFRFSVNTSYIIDNFEHLTPSLDRRIEACSKVADAGYKLGVMLAPVFIYDGWQNDYSEVLDKLNEKLGDKISTFEIVTHRYTTKAKETIQNIFNDTLLDMNDSNRKFKMGQFGYGKYVYGKTDMDKIKEYFMREIAQRFTNASLLYIV